MNNKLKITGIITGAAAMLGLLAFTTITPAAGNKFLEGRKFSVQFYEMKASGRGKAMPAVVVIKGGKVQCDLMEDKINLGPATYKVTLDSTYTEDDTPMHMVTFEANYAEEKDEFKWEATVINYDIDGTTAQLKSGVEKKKFEFSGSEKTKK